MDDQRIYPLNLLDEEKCWNLSDKNKAQIYNFKYNHEVRVNKNIKKLFSYADKNNFSFILLIGEEEINSNKIILKDLKNKSQQTFEISKFELKNEIR